MVFLIGIKNISVTTKIASTFREYLRGSIATDLGRVWEGLKLFENKIVASIATKPVILNPKQRVMKTNA